LTRLEPGTVEILAATPGTLRALLASLPASVVERPDSGGWSARDIVAHLVDRGRIQRARVERLLAQPGAGIEDSDERATLAASGLRPWPLAALLDEFERARADDVVRYAALAAADLARPGVHSVAGEITVANLIHQAAYHDTQHLGQIAAALGAAPAAGRGRMGMFG
jgi:uncharacterized damage-inducible protein DinB